MSRTPIIDGSDHYAVLGVERTASGEEIRTAYRRLARQFHPDFNREADAASRMSALNEAYETLSDPLRRTDYDERLRGQGEPFAFNPPPVNPRRGYGDSGVVAQPERPAGGLSRLWRGLFRGRDTEALPGVGQPVHQHATIDIHLVEAYRGARRQITVPTRQVSGAAGQRSLEVDIPKGMRPGQVIRLAGQAEAGNGQGPAGDLLLSVRFINDPRYRVHGRDVYQMLRVAPWEAALGATVRAPVPDGILEVAVPAGSVNGRRMRLRGRGIPGTPPGDLYLKIEIVLPKADNDQARRFYERMARELDFDPRSEQPSAPEATRREAGRR